MQEFNFRKDKKSCLFLIESLGIILIISEIFYSSLLAAVILTPLFIPIYLRMKRRNDEKGRTDLMLEFRECLNSVETSLKAGYSPENAFRSAGQEMEFMYGGRSRICRELAVIVGGLDSNIPLERLLFELAVRSGVREIRDFAEIFAIAKRSGGNMTEILADTAEQIESRIEVEKEIDVLLSSRRLEQHIMDAVPFAIIFYISISSEGFFDVLYHNPAGILIMTACLAAYLAAFRLSEKILDIQV